MTRVCAAFVIAIVASSFALAGCDEEEKDYSCDETMEKMYDEGCELWCNNDGVSTVYLDECAWYDDDDPYNFDQDLAEDICDELVDQAQDEDCMNEAQDMLNCLYKKAGDDCADDCEDAYEDMMDCIW